MSAKSNRVRHRQLERLYAQVPDVKCKGLCQEACGPIGMTELEVERIEQATGQPLGLCGPDLTCPLLTADGRCSVYAVRPMVCFLPDAWIYTASGPKKIKEVFAGDSVYGADGRLHRVLATHSRLYEGKVVNVRHTGTHIPCWSTPDHKWLTVRHRDRRKKPKPQQRRWVDAGSLTPKRGRAEGDYLCFPQNFEDRPPLDALDVAAYVKGRQVGDSLLPFTGRAPEHGLVQAVPARIPVDEDFLFLLGLYLAEGSASIQAATFTMHANEIPILERVGRYLNTLAITGWNLRVRKAAMLTVPSALFGRLLKALGGVGAATKAIHPHLFASLSHAQLWSIYRAWDIGDGRNVIREKEMSTTTTSHRLAAQMGFVALANGLFPRTYVTHTSQRAGPCYDIHLFPSNWGETPARRRTKKHVG